MSETKAAVDDPDAITVQKILCITRQKWEKKSGKFVTVLLWEDLK